jgi:hypothetical protein
MRLEERVVEYLRTVEDATPRKIAKALAANRRRVKQAIEALGQRGIIEPVEPAMLVPEGMLRVLFGGAKPPKMDRPVNAARSADAHSAGVQTEVRRL